MPILAKDLIRAINDADEFFNKFGSDNRELTFRKNLIGLDHLPSFDETDWWNTEGDGAAANAYSGIIPFACLVDKTSDVLTLNLAEAVNPVYRIFKLPKPKMGNFKDSSGNYKLHKFEFGIKQVTAFVRESNTLYQTVVIDAENLSTLPEEFNKIGMVKMPSNEDNKYNYTIEIRGKQLTSYKNLFKKGVTRMTYFHGNLTPNIETFEDLEGTQISEISMFDPINFNGFHKIKQTIRIKVETDESNGNNMSFFGLDLHNIMRDKYLMVNIEGSAKAQSDLLQFRNIVKKHTDLYQDQLKTYIMKTFNPKTLEIFDAYYNNITSYPNIDTNLIAKLIGHLLK